MTHVVAVGASAGGVAALRAFVAGLPAGLRPAAEPPDGRRPSRRTHGAWFSQIADDAERAGTLIRGLIDRLPNTTVHHDQQTRIESVD